MSIQARLAQLEDRTERATSPTPGFDLSRLTEDERAIFLPLFQRAKRPDTSDTRKIKVSLLPIATGNDEATPQTKIILIGFDMQALTSAEADIFVPLYEKARDPNADDLQIERVYRMRPVTFSGDHSVSDEAEAME